VDEDVSGAPKFICSICKDPYALSDILEVPYRSSSNDDNMSSKEYGGMFESFVTLDRKKYAEQLQIVH